MIVLTALLVYLALAVLLWGLSRFVQRFIYTEVPESLVWRGAIGAGIIWFAGLVWPLLFNSMSTLTWPITFDQMFLFENVSRTDVVFQELIVPGDGESEVRYTRTRNVRGQFEYRDAEGRPLPASVMVFDAIPEGGGERRRFEVVKDKDGYIDRSDGTARYVDDAGVVMTEDNLGQITSSSYGQFFLTLMADVFIWLVWFLVIWLLMLFQWPHALGLSIPAVLLWAFALNLVPGLTS